MNVYLAIVLAAIVGRFVLDAVADWLNLRNVAEALPAEFEGCYDAGKYRTSQQYLRDNTRFHLLTDTVQTIVILAMILLGGFDLIDRVARAAGYGPILTGLLFAGILMLGSRLLDLPFSIYDTFVIEERYGFNRTTRGTFALDLLKSLVLIAVIGGPVFAAVIWFFERAGTGAWLLCWIAMTAFQILLVFLAPYVILPLFNKFAPLAEGELRSAIEDYARKQAFRMKGVFTMDGSRRSAKSNAFFTGFGRSRRIVLLDTLIAKHPVPELVAVVAHEMGHYKKHHIPKAMVRSILVTGLTLFVLSFFIGNRALFDAFGMERTSVYASLVFFGFLYAPLAMAISLVENAISRRHEYEADAYTVETTGNPEALIGGLKRLSVDNLSNLTPHPLKVFLSYSHPPMPQRIEAIRKV